MPYGQLHFVQQCQQNWRLHPSNEFHFWHIGVVVYGLALGLSVVFALLPPASTLFRLTFSSECTFLAFARMKYIVIKAASSWAHGSLSFVAAC